MKVFVFEGLVLAKQERKVCGFLKVASPPSKQTNKKPNNPPKPPNKQTKEN